MIGRLARLVTGDVSRRRLMRSAVAPAFAGLGAEALLRFDTAAAKKKRRRKKRCKPKAAGTPCSSDKQCCTNKTKRICEVPQNAGNSDTVCCGGQGGTCGGFDEVGNPLAPFCCVGQPGVRDFFCFQNDPENPNVPGTCQLKPVTPDIHHVE